ncbi:hypothetical protein RV18_GL001385 [Enterococcus termitis]|nr:hypothetical protein RV18_GL001385 [Enterococcus termitis]
MIKYESLKRGGSLLVLANRLRAHRENRGLSQTDVGIPSA